MNAPRRDPWPQPDNDTDELIDLHLAHEEWIKDRLRSDRSPLSMFLRGLRRRRRSDFLESAVGFGRPRRPASETGTTSEAVGAVLQVAEPRRARPMRSNREARRPAVVRLFQFARTAGLLLAIGMASAGTFLALSYIYPKTVNDALSVAVQQVRYWDPVLADLDRRVACATETPIVDRNGILLATRGTNDPVCARGSSTYLTTPVSEAVAIRLSEALTAIEGHSLSESGRSILGVLDWVGLGARIRDTLLNGQEFTGSPPLLTAIESARGFPGQLRLREKLRSMAIAATYTASRLPTDADRARFMAMHLPCVSHIGRDRAGGLCSWFLFGKPPEASLATDEICLLAGAMGYQIVPPGKVLPNGENHLDRLQRVKTRAANCARRTGASSADIAEALQRIDLFSPWGTIDAMRASRQALFANRPLVDGLPQVHGATDPIALTLDRGVLMRTPALLLEVLPTLDSELVEGLCFRKDPDCEAPDIVLALAEVTEPEATLALRAVWGNRHLRFFPTKSAPRPAPLTGSWTKLPLTLFAAGETALCNRRFGVITNPGGRGGVESCAAGEGLVASGLVFEQSLNLPLIDLVLRFGEVPARLYRALGYHLPSDHAHREAISMVLGTGATAVVAQHMSVMAALRDGAEGRPARTPGLSLVEGVSVAPVDLVATMRGLGLPVENTASAGRLLTGTAKPGGTAPELEETLDHLGCGQVYAKTGSAESSDHVAGTRARGLLSAFRCGDRRFVSAVLIASPGDRDMNIGRVPSKPLADLTALMTGLAIADDRE